MQDHKSVSGELQCSDEPLADGLALTAPITQISTGETLVNYSDNYAVGLTYGAISAAVITPDDDDDLADRVRAVTIGGGGTLAYVNWSGETCQTALLPEGLYPLFARRILATGTTATDITGWK